RLRAGPVRQVGDLGGVSAAEVDRGALGKGGEGVAVGAGVGAGHDVVSIRSAGGVAVHNGAAEAHVAGEGDARGGIGHVELVVEAVSIAGGCAADFDGEGGVDAHRQGVVDVERARGVARREGAVDGDDPGGEVDDTGSAEGRAGGDGIAVGAAGVRA